LYQPVIVDKIQFVCRKSFVLSQRTVYRVAINTANEFAARRQKLRKPTRHYRFPYATLALQNKVNG
jgi:hypothetical protein